MGDWDSSGNRSTGRESAISSIFHPLLVCLRTNAIRNHYGLAHRWTQWIERTIRANPKVACPARLVVRCFFSAWAVCSCSHRSTLHSGNVDGFWTFGPGELSAQSGRWRAAAVDSYLWLWRRDRLARIRTSQTSKESECIIGYAHPISILGALACTTVLLSF